LAACSGATVIAKSVKAQTNNGGSSRNARLVRSARHHKPYTSFSAAVIISPEMTKNPRTA